MFCMQMQWKSKKLQAIVDYIKYHASVYSSHELTSSSLQLWQPQQVNRNSKKPNNFTVNTNRYSYLKMHLVLVNEKSLLLVNMH